MIDVYQNKGRFLYKYAGSFLEEAAKLCFKAKFPESGSVRVPNTHGKKPKLFGVDCLVGSDALEIKWRDATTDGNRCWLTNGSIRPSPSEKRLGHYCALQCVAPAVWDLSAIGRRTCLQRIARTVERASAEIVRSHVPSDRLHAAIRFADCRSRGR